MAYLPVLFPNGKNTDEAYTVVILAAVEKIAIDGDNLFTHKQ
jgi:hypothetical protein